jgi:Leu/Phe-tRNA-protein transferase
MSAELLRYSPSGHVVIFPGDDADTVVDALIEVEYPEEFCVAPSFDTTLIAALMRAGFLVMSFRPGLPGTSDAAILLPKLHLERAVLELGSLHEARSAKRLLGRYELRVDAAFDEVLAHCAENHGEDWLTAELRAALLELRIRSMGSAPDGHEAFRSSGSDSARLVSFALFRDGRLVAGEFGVVVGSVYTSYSGYREENSAGTVQMILTARWLRDASFAFWDLGMPMEYKQALGARSLDRNDFVKRFREGRAQSPKPIPSMTMRA